MLSDTALQELLDYESSTPVLSVYLNTETNADAYKLTLRSMLKGIDMAPDEEAVLRYIEHEFARQGRSVAIFSCAEEDFFRAYPLSVPVHSRIHVAEKPYVRPLANLLDAYGAYGVALVDKQGARFFYFHLGQLLEQEGVLGEEVRQGSSSAHGRRSYEDTGVTNQDTNTAKKNFKEAAEYAVNFFEKQKVRRILLGGTEENLAQFQQALPKSWQSLIVGTFSVTMTANHQQILEEALKVGSKAEEKREAGLVQQMITSAAKAAEGVVGLRDTLHATHEGSVQTLLVDEDFHAPGYRCQSCLYITPEETDECPFCGGKFTELPDATEIAVRQVMLSGGVVEIVRNNLQMAEVGIGALLRY
jgi:peptide chain release factor subunit 1